MNQEKVGNPIRVMPKRREPRLPATLSVRVLGIDANGKPFYQVVSTVDISLSGARVGGLTARLNQGDIVGLQSSGEKCRFKIAWVEENSDGTYTAGMRCLEKGISPWRDKLSEETSGERRGDERYPCNGTASMQSTNFTTPIWGTLRDISMSGCYVQCVNVAPLNDVLTGQFTLGGVTINAVAEVRSSRPTVGMGLQWCDLGWDGLEKLQKTLHNLALNSTEASSVKMKALAQVEKLAQLIATLRQQVESGHNAIDVQILGRLADAQERLTAALKSLQG